MANEELTFEKLKEGYKGLQDDIESLAKERDKQIAELTKQLDEHAPESIYSISIGADGRPQATCRARPGEPLARYWIRFDVFRAQCAERGIGVKPQVLPQPSVQTAPSPAPASASDNGGTAHAVLMKVGKTYSGNKPQLQFTCEGMDFPLNFSKPADKMQQLLAAVGQYTLEMLAIGKVYQVDYLIDWHLGEPGTDGKRYKNIDAVRLMN